MAASDAHSEPLGFGGLPLMKTNAAIYILSLLVLGCHQQKPIEQATELVNNASVYWVVDSCGALPYIRDSG
ncbi:MAG: hypothetical protein U1F77_18145 [Kiritimatiellia bacterium]